MTPTPYRDVQTETADANVDVKTAFQLWARTVFGAPREMTSLITSVKERDESITRVATTVIRRDLAQERIPTHEHRSRKTNAVDPTSIDLFGETLNSLRTRTEQLDRCTGCNGGGITTCPACSGSRRQACSNCSGSGKVMKYYKKSSKLINCSVCRGGGTVGCGGCLSKGTITCSGCSGSGQQLVWWTFRESGRVIVQMSSDSPVATAHPQLREERFLRPADLEAFTQLASAEGAGSIAGGDLSADDDAALRKHTPAIDPRLERFKAQQFLRFGVIRRDVRYEMCGQKATVVLSGTNLIGASTSKAVRPIRLRLQLWAVAGFVLFIGSIAYMTKLFGPTEYFHNVNRFILISSLVGASAAIVAVGGLLRSFRPGSRFWPIVRFDRIATIVSVIAFLACPVAAQIAKPSAKEAQQAIAAGSLDRARLVVQALNEKPDSTPTADVIDDLELAEAAQLSGQVRLEKLDAIAARNGPRARDAKTQAQRARLDSIEAALSQKDTAEAIKQLNHWSSAISDAPGIGNLKARVYDIQGAACTDDVCRYGAAREAKAAETSPEREATLDKARQKLIENLDGRTIPSGTPLLRVQWLRSTVKSADAATLAAEGDSDIQQKAKAKAEWARSEIGKVALIGALLPVVDEILERSTASGSTSSWPELKGVSVVAANVGGVCTGLYVVGAAQYARTLTGKDEGIRKLLAQATGRPDAALHAPPTSAKPHDVSRWNEGSVPVMARWSDRALMELRIGRAEP